MNRAVVIDAVRTPVGRHGGDLAAVRPDDLGALVIRELVARTGVEPSLIEDVYFGCANQAGEDNRNVGRMSVLLAGLPYSVAATTVNRLCASGLDTMQQAARAAVVGDGEVFIAGWRGREHEPRASVCAQGRLPLPARQRDGVGHNARVAIPQPAPRGDVPAREHGRDRREHPGANEDLSPAAGRVRVAQPPAGDRRSGRGQVRPGDRAG